MDSETRFWSRPGFPPVFWTVLSAIWYGWHLYRMNLGGLQNYVVFLFIDAVVFIIGLLVWLAFFSQFVLPVSHFRERQKVFGRLISFIFGGHGPAIFVKDGYAHGHKGEANKKGAGVYWLDSASAGQLRTFAKFTRTLGPGVHFTEANEFAAGFVDLHTQTQTIGPEGSNPFAAKPDDMLDVDFKKTAAQLDRYKTSALTRDGIEVVPNITVVFKIDTDPVTGSGPGSRFGYREPDPKKLEESSVFKAIVGEGVKPLQGGGNEPFPWNQLPAFIAADVWREYLSKFTLQELFQATQSVPPEPVETLQPSLEDTTAMYLPIKMGARPNWWQDTLAESLHEINRLIQKAVYKLEDQGEADVTEGSRGVPNTSPPPAHKQVTALELINIMVNARMKRANVDELDATGKSPMTETGERVRRQMENNREFKLLQKRGLKISNVSINQLRFVKSVEEQLVNQWNASWLGNARAERDAIDRRRKLVELKAQDDSISQYASEISRDLMRKLPERGKETIKTLTLRSRATIITNDRMHRRLTTELEELEEILQWLER